MTKPAGPDPLQRFRRSSARSLLRWHRLAGPFWPYVGATPFISPYIPATTAPERRPVAPRAGRLLTPTPHGLVAVITDVPAAPLLEMAAGLAAAGFWVVPLIQRWLVTGAVLPAEPLASALYGSPLSLAVPSPAVGVMFILDGQRSGRPSLRDRRHHPSRFDNRYLYTPHVFPPPGFLKENGIAVVRLLTQRPSNAPDLAPYLRELAAHGLMGSFVG
ncbi:MAG: hypothetical protein EXR51_06595 [Dehalococcoidia bacterium]|nr:hypothetical protein [Dehalococcoidia bacterium]